MSERIHIVQIGKDDALAAIMAEQAGSTQASSKAEKNKFDFEFSVAADIANATVLADVWVLVGDTQSPQWGDVQQSPFCIRIYEKSHASQVGDEPSFEKPHLEKPLRLAQLLDTAFSSAKLHRRKQPRALNAAYEFQPFARRVVETQTGRSIGLTDKEASLLCAVLDAGEDGLQRKDAMTELWGYHPDVDSHAVDTTLYRLRQKLQELGGIEAALVNEGGFYRWKMA